jgi:hypothetical protein
MRGGRNRKRVRFTTAAKLVNELRETKSNSELNRVSSDRGGKQVDRL